MRDKQPPTTAQTQEAAQQSVEIEEDPESTANAPQPEEEPPTSRAAASSARRAARRSRRTGARALRPRPATALQRLINIEEGRLQEDEIKKYVKQILEGANLKQITMKMVCQQVFDHYPDFDRAHKRGFIKSIVKSLI